MKLAVSNIAWPREQDVALAGLFAECGIGGIEVAPTKIWAHPLNVADAEIDAYRKYWESRGIAIVAAQALLFGKPELTLFDSAERRRQTLDYLSGIVRVCARLGARSLVFGSPKNRRIGDLSPENARDIAVDFFTRLGGVAEQEGTRIVMEANPPEYGANFITRASEAIELVQAVNHPGFQLHLDTGCMALAGDPVGETLERGIGMLGHFHVSEPNLAPPAISGPVPHAVFASELHRHGYQGWASLEMREPSPFARERFAEAVKWFASLYGQRAGTIRAK